MKVIAVFAVSIAVVVAVGAVTTRLAVGQTNSEPPIPLENPAIPPDPVGGPGPLVIPLERSHQASVAESSFASPPTEVAPILVYGPSPDAPHTRFPDAKQYMLDLINAERKKAGVPDVSLGDNNAAQIHAENSIRDCVSGHWGKDGLGPPMRYSLAGGYQSNRENVSGFAYCLTDEDRSSYRPIESVESALRQSMDVYMDSPGHEENILDPWHRKVNLGLAWDTHQMWTVQHFEGDYADCSVPPTIEGTTLRVSCTVKEVVPSKYFAKQIHYDSPPHELTRGQIARSYSYRHGREVAFLRQRAPEGHSYSTNQEMRWYYPGCSPYDVDPSEPPPSSLAEARSLFNAARFCVKAGPRITIPWIDGEETITGSSFTLSHDIGSVLKEHGSGVYTLIVWGCSVPDSPDNPCEDDDSMIVVEKSIFYGIDPPDTYTPTQASASTPTPTPTPTQASASTPTPTPTPTQSSASTPTPTATPRPAATSVPVPAPRVDCGSAITDKSNTALVADCEYLLGMKSKLRGSGKLNWWSGRSLEKWDGVKVQSGRVVEVSLPDGGLSGVLPVGIGNLSALKTLDLSGNSLTGTIPASLNNLTALTKWRLAGNSLSGCVPANLAEVSDNDAASLNLSTCGGSGPGPTPVPTATPTPTPTPASDVDDTSTLLAEGHCTQADLTAALGGTYTRTDFTPLEKYEQNGWGLYAFAKSEWEKDDDSDKTVYCLSVLYDNTSSAILDTSYDRMKYLVEGDLDVLAQSKVRDLPEIGHDFIALHIQLGNADVDGDRWINENELDAVPNGGTTIAMLRRGALVVFVSESSWGPEYADRRPPAADGVVEISRRIDARLSALTE